MVFLPFSCSLISMGIAMEYVKVDLGMLFAANPHQRVNNKRIPYKEFSSSNPIRNLDDFENL